MKHLLLYTGCLAKCLCDRQQNTYFISTTEYKTEKLKLSILSRKREYEEEAVVIKYVAFTTVFALQNTNKKKGFYFPCLLVLFLIPLQEMCVATFL